MSQLRPSLLVKIMFTMLVVSMTVSFVSSINPAKVQTREQAVEQIVSDPLSVPFSMLGATLIPDTYAQWRGQSATMNAIQTNSEIISIVSLVLLVLVVLNDFRRMKNYEALSFGLGLICIIPGLIAYSHLIAPIMFSNLFDVVFLFALPVVATASFAIPSVIFYKMNLLSEAYYQEGRQKLLTILFPKRDHA